MINLFRNIRRKLADDNKPLKYMRYAIGEIALVVIGILIALQINNWNEERKSKERVFKILEEVQNELIFNLKEADYRIAACRWKDSVVNVINKKELTIDDYRKDPWLVGIINWNQPLYIVDDAFKNLLQTEGNLSIEYDTILENLKALYGRDKLFIEENDKKFNIILEDFLSNVRNTESWYSLWQEGRLIYYTDDMFNYFLSDPVYFNFIADNTKYEVMETFRRVHRFKNNATKVYKNIHILRESLEGKPLESKLIEPNAEEFKHYVGTYTSKWGTSNISIEDNKLLYEWIAKGAKPIKFDVYPTSAKHFTIGLNDSFYTLIFDENDQVISKRNHLGWHRSEQKKIK